MISPKAIHLLIKYFDAIDRLFSKYMNRKRPWEEEALTTVLCDLLDEDYQIEENISYSKIDLYNDFSKFDEPMALYTKIETHKYTKHIESNVTFADLGLIINYQNQFDRNTSFKRCWLLQSKRLFRDDRRNEFTTESKFKSYNEKQHINIQNFNKKYEDEFIKYLLYCPRPDNLEKTIREKLAYTRNKTLSADIFDYTFGLELHNDLLNENSTISSSLFFCSPTSFPNDFLSVYKQLFQGMTPFAWFLIQHFNNDRSLGRSWDIDYNINNNYEKEIERIVKGDARSLYSIYQSEDEIDGILPLNTIEIKIIHGSDRQYG
jgi:hypothetical protein